MSPIDGSRLDVTVTEGERWRRTLSVVVPADVVEAEKGAITRQLASRVKVKGFRAGKVPANIVAKRYGAAVEREALDQLIQDAYKEAISTHELRPISEGEVQNVTFAPEEPLSFTVSFDVRPEFTVARVGGFRAERPAATVPPDALEQVLERLRSQNAAWKTSESGTPEPGDYVEVELTRLDDGEGAEEPEVKKYDFVLGEGNALPDIEQAIGTLAIGEENEFDVGFPEDFPDEARRGERQRLSIRLLARRVKELPELNDDFARSVGAFDDLEALQAKIEEDLARDAERQAEGAVRGRLLQLLIEANPFEVPRSMVDGYIDSMIGNVDEIDPEKLTELKQEVWAESEHAVKRMLVIDRVADEHGLRASEEDVDARVEEIAEGVGESPSKVYANLQKSGRITALEQELTEEKLFEFLKSQSEITEAP